MYSFNMNVYLVCSFYCVNICIPVSIILSSFQISTDFSSWVTMGDCIQIKWWGCFLIQYFSRMDSIVFHIIIIGASFPPIPAPFCAGTRQHWAGKCESHFGGWAPPGVPADLNGLHFFLPWPHWPLHSPPCLQPGDGSGHMHPAQIVAQLLCLQWGCDCDIWLVQLGLHYHPVCMQFYQFNSLYRDFNIFTRLLSNFLICCWCL